MKIKLLYIWIVLFSSIIAFAQTKLTTGVQSNTGGSMQSASNKITGIMGQSSVIGLSSSASNTISGGFIATLSGDVTAPVLTHTPVTSATANQAVDIIVSASDAQSGIGLIELYYRKVGDISNFQSVNFSANQAAIPSTIHTQRGSEYFIIAYDVAENSTRLPASGAYAVLAELDAENGAANLDASGNEIAQHNGEGAGDYRIFSVPFILDDKKPSSLLEDDLGSYSDNKWKFFTVTNGILQDYEAIKNQSIVQPGKGFLLIVKSAGEIIKTGGGVSTNEINVSPISLSDGWNIIGNPFDFDIPIDSLKVNGVIPEAWYLGSSGWVNNPTHLKKWEGLAILSAGTATLNIGVASGNANKQSISNYFVEKDWGIKIAAFGKESMDVSNYAGVYSDESNLPRTAWHEPFIVGNNISLRIKPVEGVHDLAKRLNYNLSTYLQPNDEQGNFWDFEVFSNDQSDRIKIDFEKFGNLPPGFSAQVVDKNLRKMLDLNSTDWNMDVAMRNSKTREFRLVVGDEAYIEEQSISFLTPQAFVLKQNYPNPFNPSTNIVFGLPKENTISVEIYNILGQKVKTLLRNQPFAAGYHTLQWNSTNDDGSLVASGVYIIKLKGKKAVKIKKAVLIR